MRPEGLRERAWAGARPWTWGAVTARVGVLGGLLRLFVCRGMGWWLCCRRMLGNCGRAPWCGLGWRSCFSSRWPRQLSLPACGGNGSCFPLGGIDAVCILPRGGVRSGLQGFAGHTALLRVAFSQLLYAPDLLRLVLQELALFFVVLCCGQSLLTLWVSPHWLVIWVALWSSVGSLGGSCCFFVGRIW